MPKRKSSSSPGPGSHARRTGPTVAWTPEELNTVLLYLVAKSQLTLSKTDLERLQELLPGRTAEGIRLTWKNKLKPQCAGLLAGDVAGDEKKPASPAKKACKAEAKPSAAKKAKAEASDSGSE